MMETGPNDIFADGRAAKERPGCDGRRRVARLLDDRNTSPKETNEPKEDPNLRSANEILTYKVKAQTDSSAFSFSAPAVGAKVGSYWLQLDGSARFMAE
jgi:hypothetical protein